VGDPRRMWLRYSRCAALFAVLFIKETVHRLAERNVAAPTKGGAA
jgi:hypothetical protein